jgi:hypothetical protein
VGNVYERYKLSEIACEMLLDKVADLTETTDFVASNSGEFYFCKNGRNVRRLVVEIGLFFFLIEEQSQDKLFIFNMSEELTKSLRHSLWLEAKLRAAGVELEKNRLGRENLSRKIFF